MTSTLENAEQILNWPSREQILHPTGAGPQVLAELANRKIGSVLRQLIGNDTAEVGVLVSDPTASESAAPIAVVCEFSRPVTPEVLLEAHRLAWNFSRSPLLLTIEPHVIRAWTCCEIPSQPSEGHVNRGRKWDRAGD